MEHFVLVAFLVVFWCTQDAWTYPTGAPTGTCFSMNPHHGVSPQSTASPYTITVSAALYTKGSNLTVTIQGGEFKGYILQARPANESVTQWPVGTFISKAEGSQYLYCSGGSTQNTITHENTVINGRTNRTFTWEAPASVSYGDIKFWATVVKDYTTFWTNINSSIISGPPADFPDPSPGSSIDITKTECDKTKSCLSHPKSCKSSSDCDYLVTYKATGDEVEFELASKDNWAAIGFNDEAEMPDTDALICMTANNKVTVEHYVANNGKGAPSKTQPTPNSIVVSLAAQESGKVRCRFKRKKEAANMKDLNKKWYLIFAYGSVGGSDIKYHAWRSTSKEKLDVSKVQAISSSSDNARLIQAHGALMIIAWAGFATIGIFMARYMKLVWSDQTLLGQKVWFTIHRSLMTCAVLFTIIAIILIFVHVKDWSSDAGAHPYIGFIVSVLAVIQPIMAFFRPHPGTPKRWIFTWAHRGVGLVALFGAVVTIFLGVLLPHLDLDNKGVYVMIFYCVAIIVALILEIYIATRKPEGGIASYSLPGKEGEEVNMKAAPPSISDQDVKLRKFILGFLVVVVIVAILALVILIAMAADDD